MFKKIPWRYCSTVKICPNKMIYIYIYIFTIYIYILRNRDTNHHLHLYLCKNVTTILTNSVCINFLMKSNYNDSSNEIQDGFMTWRRFPHILALFRRIHGSWGVTVMTNRCKHCHIPKHTNCIDWSFSFWYIHWSRLEMIMIMTIMIVIMMMMILIIW